MPDHLVLRNENAHLVQNLAYFDKPAVNFSDNTKAKMKYYLKE